jgi:hypothetical protein
MSGHWAPWLTYLSLARHRAGVQLQIAPHRSRWSAARCQPMAPHHSMLIIGQEP